MAESHDAMPYPTAAEARLHLEHLRCCAVLNGYSPVPPQAARVLEIGCGNGFNLAPMAEAYPHARFVGLDYAASAITMGKNFLRQAGLSNMELRCVDLIDAAHPDAAQELGHFDYIIAHGFYSWVSEPVREAMWTLVRHSLAPRGMFHLSYNALPGWYGAHAVRDFAQFLAGEDGAPATTLHRTWDALGTLAQYSDSGNPFALEAARIRGLPLSVLAHDELSEVCQAFYLTGIVRRARQEGLRYAAEAGSPIPADLCKHEDVANMLASLSQNDALLHAQLLDFTSMRRFHDSLFTWESHLPTPRNLLHILLDCWAHSDIRLVHEGASGEGVYEHAGGVRVASSHPLFRALAGALQAASPAPLLLKDFLAGQIASTGLPEPILALQLVQLIRNMLESAVIRLRLSKTPVARELSARPRASTFGRLQMAAEGQAPDAYHACVSVESPWRRALFTLLDGTRDLTQLAEALTRLTLDETHRHTLEGHHPQGLLSESGHPMVPGIAASLGHPGNRSASDSYSAILAFYSSESPRALDEFLQRALLVE